MGSTKDLYVTKQPTAQELGKGVFVFTDRYSVFDWGEMPDHIPNKGLSLCLMSAWNFEQLEIVGVKTHYVGLGVSTAASSLSRVYNIENIHFQPFPGDKMIVKLANVYRDPTVYNEKLTNFLIPLEVIYRNSLPQGSSVFKRLESGELTIEQLGLKKYPQPGEKLEKPIIDVSTKLEKQDRYLTWEEAKKISSLTDSEIQELKNKTLFINDFITAQCKKKDIINEDGKFEFAMDEKRKIMLVDAVGTLDECRFTFEGEHLSKEILRQYYKKTQWYNDVEEAKKLAKANHVEDWKSLCKSGPEKLPPDLVNVVSEIYMSAANQYTGKRLFKVLGLKEIIPKYKKIKEKILR